MVGKLLSFWEGNFSGAMLNFGRVNNFSGQSRLQRSIAHLNGGFPLRFCSLQSLGFRRPDSAPITCDFIVKVQLGEKDGDVFPVDLELLWSILWMFPKIEVPKMDGL